MGDNSRGVWGGGRGGGKGGGGWGRLIEGGKYFKHCLWKVGPHIFCFIVPFDHALNNVNNALKSVLNFVL